MERLQLILRLGIVLTFIGALIFMVVNYHTFGPGSWVLALGIVIVLVGILYYLFMVDRDEAREQK